MEELTSLDLDVILYLNYCQENDLPAPDLFDLADAKGDYLDICKSANRLVGLGYVRRVEGWPFFSVVLNDVIKCNTCHLGSTPIPQGETLGERATS